MNADGEEKKNREEKKFLVTFPGGLEAQQIKSPDK